MVTAKEILAHAFSISVEIVPSNAAIDNFDPWDSLGHIAVVESIEEAIQRSLNTEEMLAVVDLAAIAELLGEHHKSKGDRPSQE